jgi:hypothetical protein
MAEKVTGTIGNDNVDLNNAASEATLIKLLQAIQAQGGSQAAANTAKLAGDAGIASNKASQALNQLGIKTGPVANAFANLFTEVNSGAPTVSGMLSGFSKLENTAGRVATALMLVAEYQEKNLETYRLITNAGASFGGSLTDLRMASANAYVTLEQFGRIIKENSTTLANMGGSVDAGARSFANLSHDLIKSQLGSNLLALGYTTDDVNTGMLNYIAATGGRTKAEMEGAAAQKALSQGTADYLQEIDRLAEITGKGRKEQEAELKKLSMQAAWENYIAKLRLTDPKAADRALAGLAEASARGGEKMAQNFQAYSMGYPPMTEANRKFAGQLQNGDQAVRELVNSTKDASKSNKDISREGAKLTYGLTKDAEALDGAAQAISLSGKDGAENMDVALRAQTQSLNRNAESLEDHQKLVDSISEDQKTRQASQAAIMTDAEKSLKELGQAVMQVINPIVEGLTPAFKLIGPIARLLGDILIGLGKTIEVVMEPVGAVINGFVYVLSGAINTIANVLENLKTPFVALGNVISNLFDAISEILSSLNPSTWFSSNPDKKEKPKMAAGGIVTRATDLIAGEAGPEAILPLDKLNNIIQTIFVTNVANLESKQTSSDKSSNSNNQEKSDRSLELFNTQLTMLNNTTNDLLRFMKDTAENTRRTHDATRALNGNVFAT